MVTMSPDEKLVALAFRIADLGTRLGVLAWLFGLANARAAPNNTKTANTAQTSLSPAIVNHSNSNVQIISRM